MAKTFGGYFILPHPVGMLFLANFTSLGADVPLAIYEKSMILLYCVPRVVLKSLKVHDT